MALKELLNTDLHLYNDHLLGVVLGKVSLSEKWWQCIHNMYMRLLGLQKFALWPRGIPPFILVERQTWLSSFFAVALGCDVPIVETLMLHWPALRIAKRDIHDHLCVHTIYSIDYTQSWLGTGIAVNIIPWQTEAEILFQ